MLHLITLEGADKFAAAIKSECPELRLKFSINENSKNLSFYEFDDTGLKKESRIKVLRLFFNLGGV